MRAQVGVTSPTAAQIFVHSGKQWQRDALLPQALLVCSTVPNQMDVPSLYLEAVHRLCPIVR